MDIRPFRGWRYDPANDGDVSDLIAPPYDVLSRDDYDRLLAGEPHNVVAVDLPHWPPAEAGPDKHYADAAWVLGEWKGKGTLVRDDKPAIYAYEQEYIWAGQTYARRAMLCGVRATPLGEDVIPHEHTFAGPKADRLKLTQFTRTQLSPIFGFFDDPQDQAASLVWSAAEGRAPDIHGRLGEVAERLWVVDDESTLAAVGRVLADVPVYIADGHHRYTTAMNYAADLRKRGEIDENHEANFVMFAMVSRRDPGLLVLPTHRIVRGLADNFSISALIKNSPEFEWKRCSVEDADLRDADAFLHRYGRHALAVMGADPAEIWIARLTDPAAMAEVAPDESETWRNLDVAILHKLLLGRNLTPWTTDDLAVEYTPDGPAVLAACRSGRGQLGVCLQHTPIEAVQAIADEGGSMPHKSTYFYPKLATGMVLKPLE